jgi:hypothetical protein
MMGRFLCRALLVGLFASVSAPSRGQRPTPSLVVGDTLAWERVGDIPVDAGALAFDEAGTL